MERVLNGVLVMVVLGWFVLNAKNINDGVSIVFNSSSFLGLTLIECICVNDFLTGDFLSSWAVKPFSLLPFLTGLGDSSAISLLSDDFQEFRYCLKGVKFRCNLLRGDSFAISSSIDGSDCCEVLSVALSNLSVNS